MTSMTDITQSWLYQTLRDIFSKAAVSLYEGQALPKEPDKHGHSDQVYFPVRQGEEHIGWIGLPATEMDNTTKQLIDALVEQQPRMWFGESEERLWAHILQQEPAAWKNRWQQQGYDRETKFGHVYVWLDQTDGPDTDTFHSMKEMIGNMLEHASFLIPLHPHMYVWIIPYYDQYQADIKPLLRGLVDTITSECMVDVLFFAGEGYTMPQDVRRLVERERTYAQVAARFRGEEKVSTYTDILPCLLLQSLPYDELKHLVNQLLGPLEHDQEAVQTLAALFAENLNVSETAKSLYIHRNSLQYRLDKIADKTGLNVRQFSDALRAYIALQALDILHKNEV
jgi:hypothetical protein